MTATEVAAAVDEARSTHQLLRFRSADIWFTPDEVTEALKANETCPLTTPFDIEPRPHPGMPIIVTGPPENRPALDTADTLFLDFVGVACIFMVVSVLMVVLFGHSGVFAGVLR